MQHGGHITKDLLGPRGVPVGGGGAESYTQRVLATGPMAYWRMNDAVGAVSVVDSSGNSYAGTPSNITFGLTGFGDGLTAASYNGTNSYINVLSAGLAAAFNGSAGTFSMWLKPANAGVWTDATRRYFADFNYSYSRWFALSRPKANSAIEMVYKTSTATYVKTISGLSFTDWTNLIVTWDIAVSIRMYLNGVEQGPAIPVAGTWGENALNLARLGHTADTWSGGIDETALWTRVLSPAEIAVVSAGPA